jgi:ParB family chromosome partitioning protein
MVTDAESISKAPVQQIPIAEIVVGVRRRKKVGGIGSLARSISMHGLIHPILLRNGNTLVAGERRLEACRRLNWRTIPARHVDALSDEELRLIELDENTEREALTDYETTRARFAEIRQIEAKRKAQVEGEDSAISAGTPTRKGRARHDQPTGKPKGRPTGKKAGSTRDVAAETGVAHKTRTEMQRHLQLADRSPFLQRPEWVRYSVLKAGEWLEKLTEDEQIVCGALLDQDAIPPPTVLGILENLVTMSAERRAEIFAKARSNDPFERRGALTTSANLPPPADHGLSYTQDALRLVVKGESVCRAAEFKAALAEEASHIKALVKRFIAYADKQRVEYEKHGLRPVN